MGTADKNIGKGESRWDNGGEVYIYVVQAVLLFGSDTWFLTPR